MVFLLLLLLLLLWLLLLLLFFVIVVLQELYTTAMFEKNYLTLFISFNMLYFEYMIVYSYGRCSIRKMMIGRGVLEWLVTYLRDCCDSIEVSTSSSSYGVEYAAALFMNLCLHRSGRERCAGQARQVLQVLLDLLRASWGCSGAHGAETDEEGAQRLPYVNGALYSLLGHSAFVAEAKQMGLAEALAQEREKSVTTFIFTHTYLTHNYCCILYPSAMDDETRRQLEHILQQLSLDENGGGGGGEGDANSGTISDDEDESLARPILGIVHSCPNK